MPGIRYVVPNAFTATSLLLGLGSIVAAQLGELELAGWMIVWCGLLDVCDGLAARLLNATSSFGAEFDSMADLVSFGVAPGRVMIATPRYITTGSSMKTASGQSSAGGTSITRQPHFATAST